MKTSYSRAVTAKKCSQKCDALANLLFCKSNAVVVAKALLWKLYAPAYRFLPTLKHPGPGDYSTCSMMIAFRKGIAFCKK